MRRTVSILVASLFASTAPALADNWVHTRDNGGGLPMCLNMDSITKKADGLTYYAVKMCNDTAPQYYAVNCDANFKVELLIRVYDVGSADHYREMTVDNLQSGMAFDADMVCHKA